MNLSEDEIQTLRKISAAIDQIIHAESSNIFHQIPLEVFSTVSASSTNKMDNSRIPLTERAKTSQHSSSPMSISFRKQERYQRQRQIIDVAKQKLKPMYRQRLITKTEYKKIMKKVVDKVCGNHRLGDTDYLCVLLGNLRRKNR